jgi:hypothetical protein
MEVEMKNDQKSCKSDTSHIPQAEGYPSNWMHCQIHLNPETGEMHSDGNHRVREWIQNRLSKNRSQLPFSKCSPETLVSIINEYLQVGGLFNPELMEHDKVRDLIIAMKDALSALTIKSKTIKISSCLGCKHKGLCTSTETRVGVDGQGCDAFEGEICCVCGWTNVDLINLGEPGNSKWVCHGCCKRMFDATNQKGILIQKETKL